MKPNVKRALCATTILCIVVSGGLGSNIRSALAVSTVTDTNVFLSGPGITLILASGSTMNSYAAGTTTLTLVMDATSNVTVKSNNLYTLTNSQNAPTQCSASPAYSYLSLTVATSTTITITPTTTVACSGTAPVIATFGASPTSITSGQSSTLSWSQSGASTVSLDNGVGSQSNASSSSVSVSPTQTTTYTLTAANYVGTTTAQTTITVSAPSSGGGGGGGGGGGSTISLPVISSFSALPSAIQSGQSSTLSWTVSGASSVNINPTVSTSSLNSLSGTATATPATTTVYTLTAFNAYDQTVTASATVTVLASAPSTPPTPATPQPTVSPTSTTSTPSSSTPAYCLVNQSGTFYLILSGIRHGIVNPGLLYSYGYGFEDAVADTTVYEALPTGDLLGPGGGALVKAPNNPTVYLVSDAATHGFTSAKVFLGLGYKFSSVLTIPVSQLGALPNGGLVSSLTARHLSGADVGSQGTVYYLDDSARYPYPSLAVFNTWHFQNDFSRVLPANAADLALPVGPVVIPRSSCNTQP